MTTTDSTRSSKLDPFAFPSTTDSRFILLILVIVGATTYVYNTLSLRLPSMREALTTTAQQCTAAAQQTSAAIGAALAGNLDPIPLTYQECVADVQMQSALWSLSGLPLLLLVTGAIYWLIPRWITRRRNLVPFDPEDAAEVVESLQSTSRAMGVKHTPVFLGAPGTRSTGALAFGLPGKRTVALNNGLVTLFYLEPLRFEAIVRHELAHIRNADIDKAYLTVSASLAFLVIGLVPLAFSMLNQPVEDILAIGLRAAALALLVALSAAAVLRARECYADLRAAESPSAAQALGELFDAAPAVHQTHWQRPLRLHLDPLERLAILRDPRRLFRAEPLELIAAGLAASMFLPRIASVVSGLTTRQGQSLSGPLVGALLLAPLIVGILGVEIWRATYASVSSGVAAPRYARLAFGLGAGFALGAPLSFDAYVEFLSDPIGLVALKVCVGLLIGAIAYALVCWQAAACTAWLRASDGLPPARRAFVLSLAVLAVAWVAALTVLLFADVTATAMNGMVTSGAPGGVGAVLIALGAGLYLVLNTLPWLSGAALIALWAFPLAASRQRSVGRAVLAGAVGGAVYVLIDLLLQRHFSSLPLAVRQSDDAKLQLLQNAVVASGVLQAGVAAFVAWRSRSTKLAHALLAAFTCGCIAVVAFVAIHVGFVPVPEFGFLVTLYVQMVCTGALAAIVTGGITARATSRAAAHLDPRLVAV